MSVASVLVSPYIGFRLPLRVRRACSALVAAAALCGALLLVAAPAAAQITFGPQLSAAPANGTALGVISVSGDRLLIGGDYRVVLVVAASDRRTLATVLDGDGEFTRNVTIPNIAQGTYTLELTVNNTVRDSVSLRVLAPLAITVTPTSPRAGSLVNFSVSGLTDGSLSLIYAGRTAFGPVNVTNSTYSGRMRIPTDRPASLPANVVLSANNGVGRLISRRGSRTLSVQAANLSPFARVLNATPSTLTPTPRQTLRVTGSVGTNEATATDVTVQHFWTGSDGRTVPMGAAQSAVTSGGTFDHTMRTPQIGTMSATQAVGSGQMNTVTQYIDANGVMQHQVTSYGSIASTFDTDAAIDINLILRGSDGLLIEGARVDLVEADLDALFPPNSNQGGVRLDGSARPGTPTQINNLAQASDELLGCPATIARKYTIAGRTEFQFGLDVPNGAYNVDGSGPTPNLTIQPSTTCVEGSINSQVCTFSDPAGIAFDVVIKAKQAGYGYLDGTSQNAEIPVVIQTRIDRYTGAITMTIKRPGFPDVNRAFQNSANIGLTLPALGTEGLTLGDVYFTKSTPIESPIEVDAVVNNEVRFKSIVDLTPFLGTSAVFSPLPVREATFQFQAGAGRPLASASFVLTRPNGSTLTLQMMRVDGTFDCDSEANVEAWSVAMPLEINEGFRFPGHIYNGGTRLTSTRYVSGKVRAVDTGGVSGESKFRFTFVPLDSSIRTLAMAGTPGLSINTGRPHARRLSVVPPIGDRVARSAAAPAEYNLPSKTSKVTGAAGYDFCIPKSETVCGAITAVGFEHEQFSKRPGSQPADSSAQATGAGGIEHNAGTMENPWVELFNHTIPLFRWYWGIPELLSAEVFADLAVRAEYLFNAKFDPIAPLDADKSAVEAGGRLAIGVFIGVDIDVLFGVLVDAGAAILGEVSAELVTKTTLSSVTGDECLKFTLDFSGWLEIGCPIPGNFFDPTCYIPNVEETFNILRSSTGSGCGIYGNAIAAAGSKLFDPSTRQAGPLDMLAMAQPITVGKSHGTPPPPVIGLPRAQRRALYRTPALAFDGTGNRMILNLDNQGRLVAREGFLRQLGSAQILSTGWGIRDVAVSYFSTDRAVAVWAESSLATVPEGAPPPQLTRNSAAAAQRLRYALFDGTRWLAPVNLTAAGFGEGQVKLARCKATFLQLRSGCTEKVSLVFQRNTRRTVGGEKHIFFSQFDGSRFSTPVQVDQSGTFNITPALTYAAGEPVVAWVRYAPTGNALDPVKLDDVGNRYLAMRVMDGRSSEQIALGSSTRFIAQPSIAGKLNGQIAIAYTTAGADNYIGTRQALRLGQRSCALSETCAFTTWQVQDDHGRPLYVERPTLNFNNAGDAVVTYRGLAVGPVPGVADPQDNLFDDDPVGIQMSRGELLQVRTPLQPSTVRPLALSANAAMHFQPAAAFDPVNDEVVGLSVAVESPQTRAAAAKAVSEGVRAVAQTAVVEPGIHLAMVPDLPDLFVESISTPSTSLAPGSNMLVTLHIANRGSAFTVNADQTATVRVWWDVPQTRTVTSASYELPSIAAGAKSIRLLQVPVPVTFGTDERQTLRAAIELSVEDGEIDGDNNEGTLAVGGMPVPTSLMAVSAAGTRFVNLVWSAPTDSRIAGYRVYIDDANGVAQPFGSSFNKGFADLTALYGRQRTYRVSTYSTRGVESELSLPVIAQPSPEAVPEDLFANGFE